MTSTIIDAWPEDDDPRWRAAVVAFARHHADDPRPWVRDAQTITVSLDYHARVSAWVKRLDPTAPLATRLGALAQHVRRFELPRDAYPTGTLGYKRWRSAAGLRHTEIARTELAQIGYDADTVAHTCAVMLKQRLADDPAAALLEDAVCLRFVQDELAGFADGREPEALRVIVAKTWAKMTGAGHRAALGLVESLPPSLAALVTAAVAG